MKKARSSVAAAGSLFFLWVKKVFCAHGARARVTAWRAHVKLLQRDDVFDSSLPIGMKAGPGGPKVSPQSKLFFSSF